MTRKPIEKNLQYFMERISIDSSGCWNWTKWLNGHWYWIIKNKGKVRYAHRELYLLSKWPIPEWLFACHKCDNPKCCNPDHIFLGTNQDNMDDMNRKGRGRPSCYFKKWNKFRARKVMIDGQEFESMVVAAKHFWITDKGVIKRYKDRVIYL